MRIMILVAAFWVAGLSGCINANPCESRTDYKQVTPQRQIRVPEGMDPLSARDRLEIPASSTPPDGKKECLEKPPKFTEAQGG
ncbi:MAG: hypothetical protein AAGA84_10815 [Pseudomonadota bacterium]